MPPVKTAFSLRFGPKPSSSQGVEPGRDRPEPSASSQTDKRRKKKLRSKTGAEKIRTPPRLKVQLFERNKVTKENKTPTKWTLELATRQNKTNINQGGQTQSVNPALIDGDVFFFSELSNTPPTKEKYFQSDGQASGVTELKLLHRRVLVWPLRSSRRRGSGSAVFFFLVFLEIVCVLDHLWKRKKSMCRQDFLRFMEYVSTNRVCF